MVLLVIGSITSIGDISLIMAFITSMAFEAFMASSFIITKLELGFESMATLTCRITTTTPAFKAFTSS